MLVMHSPRYKERHARGGRADQEKEEERKSAILSLNHFSISSPLQPRKKGGGAYQGERTRGGKGKPSPLLRPSICKKGSLFPIKLEGEKRKGKKLIKKKRGGKKKRGFAAYPF